MEDELLKMAQEGDKTVRLFAMKKLMNSFKGKADSVIVDCLEDEEYLIRIAAVKLVANSGDTTNAPLLIRRLDVDNHVFVRATIYSALSFLGDKKTIPVISQGLGEKDSRIKANVIEALGRFNDPHICALMNSFAGDKDNRVSTNALMAITPKNEKSIAENFMIPLQEGNVLARASAAWALGFFKYPKVSSLLCQASVDRDPMVRKNAVISLGRMGNMDSIKNLMRIFLEDREMKVRHSALLAMRNIDLARTLEFMSASYEIEQDPKKRAIIMGGIGYIDSPMGISLLTRGLSDKDDRVIANAIEALSNYRHNGLVSSIMPFLGSKVPRIKANSARALWNLGVLSAFSSLRKMLADGDERVKSSAAYALSVINTDLRMTAA